MRPLVLLFLISALSFFVSPTAGQVPFEEAVVDVGNVGLTVTNSGFIGHANVRNNPTGPPSFEYPLNSGIEHLFEAGLWVGGIREGVGDIQVRTGAVTTSGGYSPGTGGYEFAPLSIFQRRSSLPTSQYFSRTAVSQQDLITSFTDTFSVLPGTQIPMPDPAGSMGLVVQQRSYAYGFPFADAFVIVNFDIINRGQAPIDSVYVGLYHDLVVRNVNTTTETGSDFFNKNGLGFIDSLNASYAFNLGGQEPTLNTYGSLVVLGAEWPDPDAEGRRFFYPSVADEYRQDGLTAPYVNPRWWLFSSGQAEFDRPGNDQGKYTYMSTPYPNPAVYNCDSVYDIQCEDPIYQQQLGDYYERLRTDGLNSEGNWIGLTSLGPFPELASGDTLTVTFAAVAALKPEEFQGQAGKQVDTEASRRLLRENIGWARRTFAGEDANYNGRLDAGEDINGNGRLDRYLIPEPPQAPNVHVEFERTSQDGETEDTRVALYWSELPEASVDPVTGELDFEGYRIYRSPVDASQSGNILQEATLVAQFDQVGNNTGFNSGFSEIRLEEPVTFDGTEYHYRYVFDDLLNGWQYLFSVTAFDEGNAEVGLSSFESGRAQSSIRIFPGTPPGGGSAEVGVYPNPYRVNAAWDGASSRARRLNFYNLPARSTIRIYTMNGEIIKTLEHDESTYQGDIRWYSTFSGENRRIAGGEHSWDVLSESSLDISSGLYFYTVEDLESGETQQGKFVIIK